MLKKVLVFLSGVVIVIGGGFGAISLLESRGVWQMVGLMLLALCAWSFIDLLVWMYRGRSSLFTCAPERVCPTYPLLIITAVAVIAVYIASWSGVLPVAIALH